jgi:hypothetical protein
VDGIGVVPAVRYLPHANDHPIPTLQVRHRVELILIHDLRLLVVSQRHVLSVGELKRDLLRAGIHGADGTFGHSGLPTLWRAEDPAQDLADVTRPRAAARADEKQDACRDTRDSANGCHTPSLRDALQCAIPVPAATNTSGHVRGRSRTTMVWPPGPRAIP